MAGTQITTRIALKNDISSKWESSTLVALKGEYLFDSERKYIKVGDGTKTWKELDTIHIPVSAVDGLTDVDKDTIYGLSATGTEVKLVSADSRLETPVWGEVNSWDISSLIATQVEAEKTRAEGVESTLLAAINDNSTAISTETSRAEGVESGLDTRIKAIEDDYLTSEDKKELSDAIVAEETRAKGIEKELSDAIDDVVGDYATKAEVNAISTLLSTDVKTNRDAIATLNGADTVEGSVAKSIKDAIEALDVAELTVGPAESIKSIKEEDGKIVVEKQSIQLSGTDQVTGLDDKLSNNLTALNQEIADRKAADTELSTDYNNKIDDIKAKYALSADVTAISNDLGTKIANEETRATEAEEDLAGRLDVIEGEETVDGSIKKALKDAKDYANSLCADLSTTADAKFVKYAEVQTPITETNKVATMADVAGLSGVIHFRGITETEFTGEGKPDTAWYADHDAEAGDIVVDGTNSKEWMFDGNKWLELGDESKYVEKAFELNGHQLTGTTLDLVGSDIKVGGIYADKNVDEALDQLSADAKAYTDEVSAALSTDYVGKIATAKSEAISTVVGTDADLSSADTVYGAKAYADDKVAELQGNALTGVTLNNVPAEVENNVAVFDISAIVCGGAE